MNATELSLAVCTEAKRLGFLDCKISQPHLSAEHDEKLRAWLTQGYEGEMAFFHKHGTARNHADYVLPEAQSVIMVALPYWTEDFDQTRAILADSHAAYVSRYAVGRDYHKVLRSRLKQLAQYLSTLVPEGIHRPVVDSAPVSEVSFAVQAGLGWRGKHTLLLQKNTGSFYFLGALLTSVKIEPTEAINGHCGQCSRCIQACPTGAIVGPHTVDARRCISYLTIELPTIVPEPFRKAMGNRIYGCDDCQLVCPFNRFTPDSAEADFQVRHNLNQVGLLDLLAWTEDDFKERMAGSPIYRIGFHKWLSNILIALGNADSNAHIAARIRPFCSHELPLIAEAAQWASAQHRSE
ncbi:MAG: tRNA epoxyqueuosine(34) reductase QueG [Vitreoscilla sp.]|nr:tRNA epoxyqueuosine(34) reductase QueG [Vitreoscilla sp.]MBP9539941.1 tRNA epoxyqueuosine(34) reductase QueG [Vitreoscilla sp.]